MIRLGDTMVLTTVCAADVSKDVDFLPLQVEYRERQSAAGKIPGGYFKREGRPSEKEILSARIVDRPIRPMFPKNWRYETQIVAFVMCSDQQNDADVLAVCGASLSLLLSDVPFSEPIAAVRVARLNGNIILNPTFEDLATADYEFIIAGTKDSIVMVEGEGHEISEEEYLEALRVGAVAVTKICNGLEEIVRESGLAKTKRVLAAEVDHSDLKKRIESLAANDLKTLASTILAKEERSAKTKAAKDAVKEALKKELGDEKYAEIESVVGPTLKEIEKREMRELILANDVRLDGRNSKTIRKITISMGNLPRTHGSCLFTRGETQSLSSVTLGSKRDEQNIEGLLPETKKRFMLHYNFPPFSVGEVGRMTGTGRREIGHGNLAERAIRELLPSAADFPYAIRIVSDILESNGSSSMATVCAGSLALYDAGVKLKKPVAGIAMGLIKEGDRAAVLSDILGNEDFLGDMDFKVCGTRDGITACQMDMKIKGIDFALLERALHQAKEGRIHILDKMNEALSAPRADLSEFAPRMTSMKIPVEMIGLIIGPGGKMIREIQATSGVEDITIEDDGTLTISATSGTAADKARDMVEGLIRIPEEGTVYNAKVTQVREGLGAIMEFLPKKEGLMHISEIDYNRVETIGDIIQVGDVFEVKLIAVKPDGKYSLSRKAMLEKPEGYVERPRREFSGGDDRRGGGGDRRGGGDRDRRGGGGYGRR